MALTTANMVFYLSGGASNSSGDASLGGVISSNSPSPNINELFDYISAYEAEYSDAEYRCVYVKNTSTTETLYNAKVWISENTPSVYTEVEIGLGTSALGVDEQTVANESTAPIGVTFSIPLTEATALSIGDMGPSKYKAVWIKRSVTATTTGISADYVVLTFKGGTAV
jgi:hypothetical protein